MLKLFGNLWLISGREHTHPWDASAYLVAGDEPTLIDCGSILGYPALKKSLAHLGYAPNDIKRVVGTHGHWDHISGMAALREESDAKLFLHEASRQAVETGDPDSTASFLYGQLFPPIKVDAFLHDGDLLKVNGYSLKVLHTPGHTPGSVCLLTEIEGTKLLIAGDTVWGGYHPRIHSDMDAWEHSLDKLLKEEFDVVTFGHWNKPISNGWSKVAKARETFGSYFDPWFTFGEEDSSALWPEQISETN